MSKKANWQTSIPEGVKVFFDGTSLKIKGQKGSLEKVIPKEINLDVNENTISITTLRVSKQAKALFGTYKSLVTNWIVGVTEGWSKTLELVGTGYRAELSGKDLKLTVGYSHPMEIPAQEGIDFEVEKTQIVVRGIDKELVGLVSAKIRAIRPPEPYKGKGIKYLDEVVRRKAGKAAKAVGAPA